MAVPRWIKPRSSVSNRSKQNNAVSVRRLQAGRYEFEESVIGPRHLELPRCGLGKRGNRLESRAIRDLRSASGNIHLHAIF